ncbi:MAG TPA: four helix bundle protein [Thermoanaerobaculia bacterium]|nr:four helix bundle protein [Thermoanaerobaculia bacterium]
MRGSSCVQCALDLMVDVYTVTDRFPKTELQGLTAQLRRASCVVVSKIAEGQGRLTYGEWRQQLSEARGSLHEVRAQVIAAHKLQFLELSVADYLQKRARLVAVELHGLIECVRRRIADRRPDP